MRVTEHIRAIRIPFEISIAPGVRLPREVYAFAVFGREIALVDSGVAGAAETLFDEVRSGERSPEGITWLLLTHAHPDHIGAAKTIKERTGCRVAAHALDKNWIEDTDRQIRERPVPGFQSLVEGPVGVDRVLAEGDIVDLGNGVGLQTIHTPGHSAGSISLWMEEDGALFAGDVVLLPGSMPIYDDVAALVQSIRRLRGISGLKWLLSSWDAPRTADEARRIMEESLAYLRLVHETVLRAATHEDGDGPMGLCRRVVADLGLPATAANPLVARSIAAHVRAGESLRWTDD